MLRVTESSPLVLYMGRPARLEEGEGGAGVDDGVVGVLLDGRAQQIAGQEAQAELALPLEVEQLHRVHHLGCTEHQSCSGYLVESDAPASMLLAILCMAMSSYISIAPGA